MRVFAPLLGLALLFGCASARQGSRPLDLPYSEIYPGTFDTVWNATIRVLDIYSITTANRESGLLKTDWSDFRFNRDLFEYPDREERLEEVRYRLEIKLSKGIISQTGEPAVRVQVNKELEQYKNFYSDWERIPTDGLEEKIILYRVGQRLKIAEAIRRKSAGSKEALKTAKSIKPEGAVEPTPPPTPPASDKK